MEIHWSTQVGADLEQIGRAIGGHQAARTVVGGLFNRCLVLETLPEQGSPLRGKKQGRAFTPFGLSHTIIYKVKDNVVEILRIYPVPPKI